MVGELVPSSVDPATAGVDFWRRYHKFRRVRQKESRPDDPLRDDADEEAHMKRVSPFQETVYYEVFRDGEILGLLQGSSVKPASPEYVSNRHLYEADIFVRSEFRRRGIASSFLPGEPPRDPADRIILATARDLGATLITRDRLLLKYSEAGQVSTIPC